MNVQIAGLIAGVVINTRQGESNDQDQTINQLVCLE